MILILRTEARDFLLQQLFHVSGGNASIDVFCAHMASSQNHFSDISNQSNSLHLSTNSDASQWEDVTHVFNTARSCMRIGEMIHSSRFTLFAAMSAIELMDPKMDVGAGVERDILDVPIPDTLTDIQVINIMDRLLACEMSWLNSHTLPQTVFSCVYTQRLEEVSRSDLFTFIRLQLATMDCVMNLILDEKVAEEEDFISWTFGFRLPGLECQNSDNEEEYILRLVAAASVSFDDRSYADAILLRLRLRATFYRALRWLTGHYPRTSPFDASQLVDNWSSLVESWARCPYRHQVDENFLDIIFDTSVNRHLLTSTPPCTAPLLNQDSACNYLQNLVAEIRALLTLRHLALPPDKTHRGSIRHSLHVAIHALETYCTENKPQVLTRSLMSRLMMMIPDRSTFLFDNEGAEFVHLIATDMGLNTCHGPKHPARAGLEALRGGIISMLQCFCRNRSRQRQQLPQVMRLWDKFLLLGSIEHSLHGIENGFTKTMGNPDDRVSSNYRAQHQTTDNPATGGSDSEGKSDTDHGARNGDTPSDVSIDLTRRPRENPPLKLVALEVSCRLLAHHFLLGFECELYHEFEYNAVFFYVGCIFTCLTNATTSLAHCGLKEASLHPLRYSLYIMDEARQTLCRALSLALTSLSEGPQWRYTFRRDQLQRRSNRHMFGSESLWYEQRFAVTRGLRYAPPHFTYSTFKSHFELQDEKLFGENPSEDIILLRLKEAAKLFLSTRRKLEEAKKAADACDPNMVSRDILKLGRVAVGNSLTMSQVVREYSSRQTRGCKELYKVSFSFGTHSHFPVIKVEEIK